MAKRKSTSKYPWYYKYLFAAARRTFRWSPARRAVKNRAKDKCELCGKKDKKIAVDHILPVVDPSLGFTTWDSYYSRLFVSEENLQALCKVHHSEKTKAENELRRKVKSAKKS